MAQNHKWHMPIYGAVSQQGYFARNIFVIKFLYSKPVLTR